MLAEEAKACFSPWSTCWLHSSLEFEKSLLHYLHNQSAVRQKQPDVALQASSAEVSKKADHQFRPR